MNSGIHNVLLAHYTWKGIIKPQFWLENSVPNATTLLTERKKIVHIMQIDEVYFFSYVRRFISFFLGKKKTS